MSNFLALEIHLRKYLTYLPPWIYTYLYSKGRQLYIEAFLKEYLPLQPIYPHHPIKLWGIPFQSDLFNAAGIFKDGRGYNIALQQGAGAFLVGTTTYLPKKGNPSLPFIPYPRSRSASNWMGLPNPGHKAVASLLSRITPKEGVPLGASLSQDLPNTSTLVEGMVWYAHAGVSFLEINESCPNVCSPHQNIFTRLEYVSNHFLKKRSRNLPVIIKFSCDTTIEEIPILLDALFELGFDGVNFGNTSTAYHLSQGNIHPQERHLFDFFTQTYGGGLSGSILKEKSLLLSKHAVAYRDEYKPSQEFHVIRTGGIETKEDLEASRNHGVSLNQWFTGYFSRQHISKEIKECLAYTTET